MVRIGRFSLVDMFPLPLTRSWCATWLALAKYEGVGVSIVGSLEMILIVFHDFRLLCVRSIEVIISFVPKRYNHIVVKSTICFGDGLIHASFPVTDIGVVLDRHLKKCHITFQMWCKSTLIS